MIKNAFLALGILAMGVMASTASAANIQFTDWQDSNFHYDNQGYAELSPSAELLFNGFDSSLGILTSVSIYMSISETLNNTIYNGSSRPKAISGVSATSTTSLSGPLGLSVAFTLTTPAYTGSVGVGLSTVGSSSFNGDTSISTISTPTNLSSYIGGINAISLQILYSDFLSGSVSGKVFAGNETYLDVVAHIRYGYAKILEPSIIILLSIGFAAMVTPRRKAIGIA